MWIPGTDLPTLFSSRTQTPCGHCCFRSSDPGRHLNIPDLGKNFDEWPGTPVPGFQEPIPDAMLPDVSSGMRLQVQPSPLVSSEMLYSGRAPSDTPGTDTPPSIHTLL